MSVLNEKRFHDEKSAYKYVESRVWPEGRVCPHCGARDRSAPLTGRSTRIGVYKCYVCRKPFTVKAGTIFQSSHIKLHLWVQAIFLLCSSKAAISSNQLHRTLGITFTSARFMAQRIRQALGSVDADLSGAGAVDREITVAAAARREDFTRPDRGDDKRAPASGRRLRRRARSSPPL